MIYSAIYHSPIGEYTIGSDGEHLLGLWKQKQRYFPVGITNEMVPQENLPIFELTRQWLTSYFAGDRPAIQSLPLAPSGSNFQQTVWDILCKIPYGSLVTYGDVAKEVAERLGKKVMSAQAVGGAVGRNPISIIIPCHRVVGSNGSLTGYGGGIDAKVWLLKHEKAFTPALFVPKSGTAL
ncbi:methylated-DNA--[protein]-cysteine S-methyltransferase [Ruminococcaceae bacterium OttesenSCG-928-D13]|nr:methylated-DNA--[protein]-cysteine S-methyltransferase [Ruminococcaceae bacterium OttesenSCG-928-D13]